MEELLEKYTHLIWECEDSIGKLVKKDQGLFQRIERITAIKGIGTLTVVKLLAETDGFRKCSSIKKLVSYAGLDVVEQQSGNKSGRSKISKKGNAHIREALYMPALCASRFDQRFMAFYQRLSKRQNSKKQSITAVMRKLLTVIYTLWKKQGPYDPNHGIINKKGEVALAAG